jgi:hypothetical protein
MKKCKYCNKEFVTGNQVGGHQTSCKLNPNSKKIRDKISASKKHEIIEYTLVCYKCESSYTIKITENDFLKNRYPKNCSLQCANARNHTIETKEKISFSLNLKYNDRKIIRHCSTVNCESKLSNNNASGFCKLHYHNSLFFRNKLKQGLLKSTKELGGYRTKSGRSKIHGGYYKEVWMDSSWELEFAKRLDSLKIKWERKNIRKFDYLDFNEKNKKYYPDFYLPDFDLYVEIKGYWTKENIHKMKKVQEIYKSVKFKILDKIKDIKEFTINN